MRAVHAMMTSEYGHVAGHAAPETYGVIGAVSWSPRSESTGLMALFAERASPRRPTLTALANIVTSIDSSLAALLATKNFTETAHALPQI